MLSLGANDGTSPGPSGSQLEGITGTIPPELAELTGLIELDLQVGLEGPSRGPCSGATLVPCIHAAALHSLPSRGTL